MGRLLKTDAPAVSQRESDVLYLGISGVLHPSESLYILVNQRSPWDCGHQPYEAVPILANMLSDWPQVRIVLTSTQPWSKGLDHVLASLGPTLACRVDGFTYADLTTRARLGVRGGPLSDEDYWRCNKSDIVRLHVQWLQPRAWLALDDDTILWREEERRNHLVEVDGCLGLAADVDAQDRLQMSLARMFRRA